MPTMALHELYWDRAGVVTTPIGPTTPDAPCWQATIVTFSLAGWALLLCASQMGG